MSRINWQVTIQKLCSAWVGWPDRPCYSSGTHSASLCLRGNMRPESRAPPTGNMAARIAQRFKELGEKGSMWTIRMVGNSSTKGLESPSHCASSSDLKRIYCHSKTGWPEGIPSGQFSLSPTPHSLLQKANAHFLMGLPQRQATCQWCVMVETQALNLNVAWLSVLLKAPCSTSILLPQPQEAGRLQTISACG